MRVWVSQPSQFGDSRLIGVLGEGTHEPLQGAIPTDYHGIPFDEWLDIFLQYALLTAEQGEPEESYEALDSAALASIWLHSKPKSRLIHVCWFSESLRFLTCDSQLTPL
jgi:general transcription factor 3C polypeptide 3 (transcription factor C subunit 4)